MVKLELQELKENIPNFKQFIRLRSMVFVEANTYEFYADQWPNPRAIMVVADNPTTHEICFYASNDEDLLCILQNCEIQFHNPIKISSLDVSFAKSVLRWMKSLGYSQVYEGFYDTWAADLSAINWQEIERIADGVDPLVLKDAYTIDENWNLSHEGSLDYIKFNISQRGGGCIRNAEKSAISWCGIHRDGSLGMAFTMPDERGKGYLKKTEAFCMLQLKAKGLTPFLHINEENEASIRSAKSLGCRKIDEVVFYKFVKSEINI